MAGMPDATQTTEPVEGRDGGRAARVAPSRTNRALCSCVPPHLCDRWCRVWRVACSGHASWRDQRKPPAQESPAALTRRLERRARVSSSNLVVFFGMWNGSQFFFPNNKAREEGLVVKTFWLTKTLWKNILEQDPRQTRPLSVSLGPLSHCGLILTVASTIRNPA